MRRHNETAMNERTARVVVDNRIRLYREPVRGGVDDATIGELCRLFTHSYEPTPGVSCDISTYEIGDKTASFPRGGWARVADCLRASGYTIEVDDERSTGDQDMLDYWYEMPRVRFGPWPFQEKAIEAFLARQNCIVRSGTGSGKTNMAIAAISKLGLPALVIVDSGGLRRQWVERIESTMGLPQHLVGEIGDGEYRLATITVAMQQTLHKLVDAEDKRWLRTFGVVVADEVQKAGSDTLFKAVDAFPAKYRLGISAHEKRQDRKEFLIYDLFGRVAADVKERDVVAVGKVHPVEVVFVPTDFEADWYRAAVASGNQFRMRAAFHRLMKAMVESGARNEVALRVVRDEVASGNQVLVACHRVEHCRRFDAKLSGESIRTGCMLGGKVAKQQFDDTAAGIRDGSVRVCVGTLKAIGVGIDLPSVSAGVAVTPVGNNESAFRQLRGRICRAAEGKTGARLYMLWDRYQGLAPIERVNRWNGGNTYVVVDGEKVPADEFVKQKRAANRFAAQKEDDE
jgi:superfamily II DNA or RNA helicase